MFMGGNRPNRGFNKYNAAALAVLLALVVFLIGFDPVSWMDKIQLKLLVGGVILIVLVITLRSLYKNHR